MNKLLFIFAGVCIALLFLSFNFGLSRIAGRSMEPEIKDDTTVIYKKFFLTDPNSYRSQIVFYHPKEDSSQLRIGRVIAEPLEAVMIKNGNIYIDDGNKNKLTEEYLKPDIQTTSSQDGVWIKLDRYSYLIIGDNRTNPVDLSKAVLNRANIEGYLIHQF